MVRGNFDLTISMMAKRLKALADSSRLTILHSLCGSEKSVTELVRDTGLNQANASKHLRILREEGLVVCRRNRRNVFYSLANGLSREICDQIRRSLESETEKKREILKNFTST